MDSDWRTDSAIFSAVTAPSAILSDVIDASASFAPATAPSAIFTVETAPLASLAADTAESARDGPLTAPVASFAAVTAPSAIRSVVARVRSVMPAIDWTAFVTEPAEWLKWIAPIFTRETPAGTTRRRLYIVHVVGTA